MSRAYLQHGRRHDPESGSDQTPNMPGTWALYASAGGTTVVDSGLTYIGMDGWTWGPANQEMFSLGTGTGILAGLDAPQIDQDGVYKISILASIIGTSGDEFEFSYPGFFSLWTGLNTQAEDFTKVKLGDLDPTHTAKSIDYQQLKVIGGFFSFADAAPWASVPRVSQVSGSDPFTVSPLEILIEFKSRTYDTTLASSAQP